jgi:biopolymer transport protein ExbD
MYKLIQTSNTAHHHSFVKRPRRRDLTFTLRLTSMIDVFTILLVFLLKSYSAEGQIMSVSNDLTLPISSATKEPVTASVVIITQDLILLDGRPLVSVKKAAEDSKLQLENLYEDLSAKRIMAERVANLNQSMAFKGEITIQGDANIPFEILKKVLYTCGKAGYNNILLAVTTTAE